MKTRVIVIAGAIAVAAVGLSAQQAAAPAAQGRGGGRGAGAAGVPAFVAPLFGMADMNKDGVVTRGELMATLEKWYVDLDKANAGSITPDQLSSALATAFPAPPPAPPAAGQGAQCGGRANLPTVGQTPCPADVTKMTAALPATAPAKPSKPRKILVLGNAQGFVHSSIPLAAKMVDEMGTKYKTWTTTITYDPKDINTENLKQYDLVFLSSTTGCFLDAMPGQTPASKTDVDARRAALMSFVRGGKGIAGIHASTDSYHNACPTAEPAANAGAGRGGRGGRGGANAGPGGQLTTQIVTAADKNTDQKLTITELDAVANAWFDTMDTRKTGRVAQAEFTTYFTEVLAQAGGGGRGGGRGGNAGGTPVARGSQKLPAEGSWPEFNKMIGGYFKFHWGNGTHIPVKVDDPKSPLTKVFAGKDFEVIDETYTFAQDSFSRENVHVLTSVNYATMPQATKDMEPAATARTDGDYALSYIRREGQGRMFYEANGHDESIYAMPNMMAHVLAGIQYALGDLKADDSPSIKAKK